MTTRVAALIATVHTATGIPGFRDYAPTATPLPYFVVFDDLSASPSLSGDSDMKAFRVLMQVSLWQAHGAESDTARVSAVTAIDGYRDPGSGRSFSVDGWQRLIEGESDGNRVIHNPITVHAHEVRAG